MKQDKKKKKSAVKKLGAKRFDASEEFVLNIFFEDEETPFDSEDKKKRKSY